MSKFRPWAFWRRVQYGAGFSTLCLFLGVVIYYTSFYSAPTCFDNLQNGGERAVDCDGSCKRICSISVLPPRVVWSESFAIIDGQYNAVAYIENKNITAASPELRYTFKLLEKGSVIAERAGVTILPPNSVYPIFEGRILTQDGRTPTETVIEIEPVEKWYPATIGRSQFNILEQNLLSTDSRPRLTVKVENTELTDAEDIEVVATIFDRSGKPLTASQTFIDSITARTTKDIVFTWPNSIAKTVRSCEIPSDIMLVLDRSGSMAADGGVPPEPLQSAKVAAQNFVLKAQSTTQVGFLSYATTPTSPIEQILTSSKQAVANAIASTTMVEGGVQYTNMGDALLAALSELKSERHKDNARKVIIFLTDGDVTRPINPETGLADRDFAAAYALEKATEAKAAGVTIYTIGFGKSLTGTDSSTNRDVELIKNLASEPTLYFTAPTIADLEKVYQQIAVGLCEDGPTKIEVITKTGTNFDIR